MNRLLLVYFFVFMSAYCFSQTDTLRQGGKYYGSSLYIYNPSIEGSYSVKKIIVNQDTITENIATNGIEIDFASLGLKDEALVDIQIVYDSSETPTIVNNDALKGQRKFRFSRPKYSNEFLQWYISGDLSDMPIIVEHFKWGEWRDVGQVDPLDTVKNNFYQYNIQLHSGINKIRLSTLNIENVKVVSKEVRYRPARLQSVVLKTTKIKEEIVFSRETEYELYDLNGELKEKGINRYVDMKSYPKGIYWLNYDDATIQIKKK